MTGDSAGSLQARKRRIRETAIQRRDALAGRAHRDASQRIRERLLNLPAVATARSLFVFISFGSEVDTHPLIAALLASGRRVAVPRILDATHMRAVPLDDWNDLVPGRWGILAPRRSEPAPGPFDAALVPGVAFTPERARIGHGRGYYDRWLANNPVATTIAPAFETQIVPELPVEPHDRPVDILVTEQRVLPPQA